MINYVFKEKIDFKYLNTEEIKKNNLKNKILLIVRTDMKS